MKKVLLAIVVSMFAVAAQAGSVNLLPSAITVAPGTVFILELVVTDVGGGEAAGVLLTFNPALVHVLGVAEGDYIAQQAPEAPSQLGGWKNTKGTLNITMSRLGAKASWGNGTAIIVTFHCEAQGVATVSFRIGVADKDWNAVQKVGKMTVTQLIVPEPMTMALAGAALAALALAARKR